MKGKIFHTIAGVVLVSLCVVVQACSDDWMYDTNGNLDGILASPKDLKCDMSNDPEYVFSWSRVKNAESYTFKLYRENVLVDTKIIEDPQSVMIAQASVPVSLTELGVRYAVEVEANAGGESSKPVATAITTPVYVELGPTTPNFMITFQEALKSRNSIMLQGGDYSGLMTTAVSIQDSAFTCIIKAKDANDKPHNLALAIKYYAKATGGSLSIRDINCKGDGSKNFIELMLETGAYATVDGFAVGDILIKNCEVKNYNYSLIRPSHSSPMPNSSVESITVESCIIGPFTGVGTASADIIEFREIPIMALNLRNSTFMNAANNNKGFARMDANTKGTVTIDHCTFYSVSNTTGTDGANAMFYLRSAGTRRISNCLITQSTSNSANPDGLAYSYNYYWQMTSNAMSKDDTKTVLSVSPFANDPSTGDFTLPVGSPLRTGGVKGTCVGDPRWAQ